MQVKVLGLQEAYAKMQQVPVKMERNILRRALRQGAKVLFDETKSRVPRGFAKVKRSVRLNTDGQRGRATATVKAGGRRSPAWFAHIVETGAGANYIGTGKKSKRKAYVITPKKGEMRKVLVSRKIKRNKVVEEKFEMRSTVKFLKIPMKGAKGKFAFRSKVITPGARARPFMKPAFDAKQEAAVDAFVAAVKREVARL